MLHPYTIFFEELWREPERRTVDEPTGNELAEDELYGDELYGDELAVHEPTLHRRGGSEPTGGGPATATGPRATRRGLWGAIVRVGHRHAR